MKQHLMVKNLFLRFLIISQHNLATFHNSVQNSIGVPDSKFKIYFIVPIGKSVLETMLPHKSPTVQHCYFQVV